MLPVFLLLSDFKFVTFNRKNNPEALKKLEEYVEEKLIR
jgi:hypothetical protein